MTVLHRIVLPHLDAGEDDGSRLIREVNLVANWSAKVAESGYISRKHPLHSI